MNVNGKTRIACLFGYPVEHTLSPLMHNAAFSAMGINACYVPFSVSPGDLAGAVQSIRSLNLLGANVTVPHKEHVLEYLDSINDEAKFIGAVNTITNKNGMLTGYNTDGRGFMSSLADSGISAKDKDILIMGAGGASRAVSYYLSEVCRTLHIYDIDRDRVKRLVSDLNTLRGNVRCPEDLQDIQLPDILINATPLGLKQDDPLPVPEDFITRDMTVCDLIYKKTGLLNAAESRGAKTMNGAGMLLWQGVLAFELWTGTKPPVDIMKKELFSNTG